MKINIEALTLLVISHVFMVGLSVHYSSWAPIVAILGIDLIAIGVYLWNRSAQEEKKQNEE